jgi:hypothetical protein
LKLDENEKDLKDIYIFSDNCGPQNKNYFIFRFLSLFASKYKIMVTHIYPEVGDIYNSCDKKFSHFSKRIRRTTSIETRERYLEIINDQEDKFELVEGKVYDFKHLESFIDKNQLKDIRISQARMIEYLPNSKINVYNNYDRDMGKIKVNKKTIIMGQTINIKPKISWETFDVDLNLENSGKISEEKINDVRNLFKYMNRENAEKLNDSFIDYAK